MNARPPFSLTARAAAGALLGLWLAAAQPAQAEILPVIDSITVDKSLRRLYLIKDGKTVRAYKIALGLAPEGRKLKEGDYRTPEGEYYISARKADSSFMLALQVSYPMKLTWQGPRRPKSRPAVSSWCTGGPFVPTTGGTATTTRRVTGPTAVFPSATPQCWKSG